jgi:hypothetical protein
MIIITENSFVKGILAQEFIFQSNVDNPFKDAFYKYYSL